MDCITDLVKELGITKIIFQMKEEMERQDFLENLIYKNLDFNLIMDDYNNYKPNVDCNEEYLDDLDQIFQYHLEDKNYLEENILGFDIEDEDFDINDLQNILESIVVEYKSELNYCYNCFKKIELQIKENNNDIQFINIDIETYTIYIKYKNNNYNLDLLELGY